MKIYFAYPIYDYENDYRNACINKVDSFCKESGIDNYKIINPCMFNIDYSIIGECDIIAFFPNSEHIWTDDVIKKLIFSIKKKKRLVIFNNISCVNSDLVLALIDNISDVGIISI